MKKTLIASVLIILLQLSYILKLRHDLSIRKTINEQTIMRVLDKTFEYTKSEDDRTVELKNNELPEPSNYTDNPNMVERIEMLEMHLDYNPSKKWIKDVLSSAKNKLEIH